MHLFCRSQSGPLGFRHDFSFSRSLSEYVSNQQKLVFHPSSVRSKRNSEANRLHAFSQQIVQLGTAREGTPRLTLSIAESGMKSTVVLCAVLLGCSGCKDCNRVNNPVSPDYPCGTRAHPCSLTPLMCCWNSEVCGGPVGTGCPAGMCCFIGDDYSAPSPSASAAASAKPGAKAEPQRGVETR